MLSDTQLTVLIIIGMVTFSGVIQSVIRAKYSLPHGKRARHEETIRSREESSGHVEKLKVENQRLTDQVETMQDRLVVLERIVTDRGYGLANEIEALRDARPAGPTHQPKSEIQ